MDFFKPWLWYMFMQILDTLSAPHSDSSSIHNTLLPNSSATFTSSTSTRVKTPVPTMNATEDNLTRTSTPQISTISSSSISTAANTSSLPAQNATNATTTLTTTTQITTISSSSISTTANTSPPPAQNATNATTTLTTTTQISTISSSSIPTTANTLPLPAQNATNATTTLTTTTQISTISSSSVSTTVNTSPLSAKNATNATTTLATTTQISPKTNPKSSSTTPNTPTESTDAESDDLDWLTKFIRTLSRIAIFVILIYLMAVFYWLPEKTLWDKMLAVLGTTLLLQLWCVAYGLDWLSINAANKLWNYSLLSCSIWILVLFYEYRRSLHKGPRVYVGTDSASKTFYWYLIFNLVVSLLVIQLYSHKPNSHGKTIHEKLMPEFCLPAFLASAGLFALTCCIVLETIDKLYRDDQLYSSSQHLNMPARSILTMSLVWMIASLSFLVPWHMANWIFYGLHLTQAVLYLIFTYNEIKERTKKKLNDVLYGRDREHEFSLLHNEEERVPVMSMNLIEQPKRTENSTFYTTNKSYA